MESFTIRAMAKVNLGLDVIRRLENGYHQVKMIMQTVDLYDELTFERTEGGIQLEVDQEVLPADESNLVWKAAKLLLEHFSPVGGVKIRLKKRIPMAAGMAGGSSDAAAVFHGLNRLFSLGMNTEDMRKLAVRIGADVPFCITGGTMLSEGIGEILTPLPHVKSGFLVIAKPDISVSTKYVYEHLHVEKIKHHPDIANVERAIREENLEEMCACMENILETVTEKKYPVISQIKSELKRKGALTALMSGSGPSVFGIFRIKEQAMEACEAIRKKEFTKELFVTNFADRSCIFQDAFSDVRE